MKTNNYLTLCLEQATKSPLHYRHGCIIVRGGKVIGQGYNDYRPGYNGGALKHGRVANSALDGPALADMKMRLKQCKGKQDKQEQQMEVEEFMAFEKMGGGGGAHANTPLSMHSEMMAIHSALSTSSNMACSTFSREKPCFKLPRGDKKKERLRRDVLKTYVERICEATGATTISGGKAQVQECRFESSTSQRRGAEQSGSDQAAAGRRGQGLSGREEYWETPESEREERETTTVRVSQSTSQQRSFWETDAARVFIPTATTALCV